MQGAKRETIIDYSRSGFAHASGACTVMRATGMQEPWSLWPPHRRILDRHRVEIGTELHMKLPLCTKEGVVLDFTTNPTESPFAAVLSYYTYA